MNDYLDVTDISVRMSEYYGPVILDCGDQIAELVKKAPWWVKEVTISDLQKEHEYDEAKVDITIKVHEHPDCVEVMHALVEDIEGHMEEMSWIKYQGFIIRTSDGLYRSLDDVPAIFQSTPLLIQITAVLGHVVIPASEQVIMEISTTHERADAPEIPQDVVEMLLKAATRSELEDKAFGDSEYRWDLAGRELASGYTGRAGREIFVNPIGGYAPTRYKGDISPFQLGRAGEYARNDSMGD